MMLSSENFNIDNDANDEVDVEQRRLNVETTETLSTNDKPSAPHRPLRRSLSMQHREQNKVMK